MPQPEANVQFDREVSNPAFLVLSRLAELGARHWQVWVEVLQVEPDPWVAVQSLFAVHWTHELLKHLGVGLEQLASPPH